MARVQPLSLLTSSSAKWTTTQEKTITRDYPFTDIHLETPDQFVVRTYLQFLWLPESIMPLGSLVPSLNRVQDVPSRSPDTPHPFHALLDPLLLSVRSSFAKYHTELPQILAQDGGRGEAEESMMWYALGYEMGEGGEGSTSASVDGEDAVMLEEQSRNVWLERLERREVQIQILLYLLKLSLPGTCTPLPPVTIPRNDVVPSAKKKRRKEKEKVIIPSAQERLESFMDKLSMWQLVTNMNDTSKRADKDERDWMQAFCEDVVERQFKSTLPNMCALLRSKLFPYSAFSDEDSESDVTRSSPASQVTGSTNPRPNRKPARSSTSTSVSKSKGKLQRSSSILSHTTASDTRSRSRSLSVSLAQDASARRSNSTSGTSSSLKRALSREISMSRGFKPRAQQSQASQAEGSCTKAPPKSKREAKKKDNHSQGVTLVAATPTKPKVRGDSRKHGHASSDPQRRSPSPGLDLNLDTHMEDEDGEGNDPGDGDSDGVPEFKEEDEDLWLPNSSPDVLLLGVRKRTASGSSSSIGFSDPTEEGGWDTPVKKRMRT